MVRAVAAEKTETSGTKVCRTGDIHKTVCAFQRLNAQLTLCLTTTSSEKQPTGQTIALIRFVDDSAPRRAAEHTSFLLFSLGRATRPVSERAKLRARRTSANVMHSKSASAMVLRGDGDFSSSWARLWRTQIRNRVMSVRSQSDNSLKVSELSRAGFSYPGCM